jgi:putative acetyltransferase
MKIYSPATRPPERIHSLLEIWEASVRATHHFLSEEDIQSIKPLVEAGLSKIPSLSLITEMGDVPLGFMGIDGAKIEMLFISPDAHGSGLGRKMVEYAVRDLGADSLDVNEQNMQGIGFYIHMGFEVLGRSPVDGQGNPFPILHMALRRPNPGLPEGYAIRHAEPIHIPVLNSIELAAATIFPKGSIPEQVFRERVPIPVLTEAMKKARLWVALREGDNTPVGYALLRIEDDGSALLAQLDVHPEHGRKKLGTALVRRVIKAVHGMGSRELYLTTFSNVPWNAPWYGKLGFRPLAAEEQPEWVRVILKEERGRGLENRVAMKLLLLVP